MKLNSFLKPVLGGLLVVSSVAPVSFASDTEDFFLRQTENRYFPIELPARSVGMGGVFAGIKGDSMSVVGNPAGLGFIDGGLIDLGFQYETLDGFDPQSNSDGDIDLYRGLLLGAYSVTDNVVLGLGFVPSFGEGDDAFNTDTDTITVPVSIAYQFDEYVSIGYGFSYINDDIDSDLLEGEMDPGFMHRLGVLFAANDCTDIGLMGMYGHGDAESRAITGAAFDGDRDMWGIRAGLAWHYTEALLMAIDLGYQANDMDGTTTMTLMPGMPRFGYEEELDILSVNAGVEYDVSEAWVVRTGLGYSHYDFESTDAALAARVSDSDIPHWAGGFSYSFTDALGADAAVQVRFGDEVDFLTGVSLNYSF